MKQGDLVLIPFPFTDLSGSKVRPALVLMSTSLDVTLAFITTQLQWAGTHRFVTNAKQPKRVEKSIVGSAQQISNNRLSFSSRALRGVRHTPITGNPSKSAIFITVIKLLSVFASVVSIGS